MQLCRHCGAEFAAGLQTACRDCRLAPDLEANWSLLSQPDGPDEIEFDMATWPGGERVGLTLDLDHRGVPWRWEPGLVLVVAASDEAVVEEVFEQQPEEGGGAEELEGLEGDEDDNGEAQAAMGDLFDAADRLLRNPTNIEALTDVDRLASVVDQSAPPFGVDVTTWEEIGRLAGAVVDGADAEDEDAVAAAARGLRDFLRQYV